MGVELAVRDWARRDPVVAARVAHVDDGRMLFMRELLADFCDHEDDIEARCLLVLTVFIGSHFVAAAHGRRSRAQVIDAALEAVTR